jgi:hypothetical protein
MRSRGICVRHGRVVQGTEQNEKNNVGVGGPEEWQDPEDTNRRAQKHRQTKDHNGTCRVQQEADERHSSNSPMGTATPKNPPTCSASKGEPSMYVYCDRTVAIKKVHPCHLKHREQGDQYEPWRPDLFRGGKAIQRAPYTTGDTSLFFSSQVLVSLRLGSQQMVDFGNSSLALAVPRGPDAPNLSFSLKLVV